MVFLGSPLIMDVWLLLGTRSWCCYGGSVAGQPQSTGGSFLRGSDEPGTALDRVKCQCYCEGAGLVWGRGAGRLRAERVVSWSSQDR